MNRPYAPPTLLAVGAPDRFEPALELMAWIQSAYIADDGPLYNPEHAHLEDAEIGCLWTNCENSRHGKRIVGQAELVKNAGGRHGAWQRARNEQQLMGWFGCLPDFVLTFDAFYANDADDASFAALVDHELYHAAQATDAMGMPAFDKVTGRPRYAIKGHDVEEFVGVVRRFGIEAAGQAATEMVIAASRKPLISPAKLALSCGTCLKVAA